MSSLPSDSASAPDVDVPLSPKDSTPEDSTPEDSTPEVEDESPRPESAAVSESESGAPSDPHPAGDANRAEDVENGHDAERADDVRRRMHEETCGNCGAQREGPYCHVCGQRYRNGPLTFKDLWQQVVFVFFDLERGFLYTVRKMTTSPDQVARRYLDGERRRFLSPVAYYLIMVTILVIGFSVLEDAWIRQMAENMDMFGTVDEQQMETTYKALNVDGREGYLRHFFDMMLAYYQYFGVLTVFAIALGARVLLKQRTVAEWLAVSLFVWGQVSLYTCITQFATIHLPAMWMSVSGAIIQAVMVGWTFSIFGESRWKSALLALLGMYGGIIIMSAVFALLLVAIITLTSWLGISVPDFLLGPA